MLFDNCSEVKNFNCYLNGDSMPSIPSIKKWLMELSSAK